VKDDRFFLLHIRDAIENIRAYTASGRTAFFADKRTQDAVIRNLEIVGEATKRLSAGATSRRPEIPWKRIAGLRDVLIHNYFGVNLDAVWEVVDARLAELAEAVQALLAGQ
jgi:uncharacterized protein with HEPN domain